MEYLFVGGPLDGQRMEVAEGTPIVRVALVQRPPPKALEVDNEGLKPPPASLKVFIEDYRLDWPAQCYRYEAT